MQPKFQPMDIQRTRYDTEFFATHIVKKEEDAKLVSQDSNQRQDQAWWTGNLGRAVQKYQKDDTSPDAVNQVFIKNFEGVLDEYYRTDIPEPMEDLKNRLNTLIGNARAFEEHKTKLFAKAWTPPVGLASLKIFITNADALKQKLEARIAATPEVRGKENKVRVEKMQQVLGLALTQLLKIAETDPKRLDEIFRLTGDRAEVQTVLTRLESDELGALGQKFAEQKNVHNIANIITKTVANLKLITPESYPYFMRAADEKDPAKKMTLLKSAIKFLPPENQALLKMLFTNLRTLSQKEKDTRMGPSNLAIVFGPNLFPPPEKPGEPPLEYAARALAATKPANELAKLLIETDVFT